MNKRYMDFVPVRKTERPEKVILPTAAREEERQEPVVVEPAPEPAHEEADFEVREVFEERSVASSAKLGVIENVEPRFVNTKVPKRALGERRGGVSAQKMAERELKEAKSEKLVGLGASRNALTGRRMPTFEKKSVADGAMTEIAAKTGVGTEEKLKVPKFVNLEKVEKRPLSKNVYQKKVVVPEEEPKGPVTIIAKPEKDSRVGTIIAVIITIILGATAGTVAFLLLPK